MLILQIFYNSHSCLPCNVLSLHCEVKVRVLKAITPGDCHLILMLSSSATYTSDLLIVFALFESGLLLSGLSRVSELLCVL